MKVLKTITSKLDNGKKKDILIGHPDSEEEFREMYKLRCDIYVKKGYIEETFYPNGLDFDEYDDQGKCVYFIAKVNKKIIGTVRIIIDEYLPTEKECFDFEEPIDMKNISRENRAEIGRLIVSRYNKHEHFPKRVIMIGMLSEVTSYFKKNNIEGGYSFIKNKLRKKLKTINAPFHVIRDFKQKYKGEIMRNYFNDCDDKVYPVYFITNELDNYNTFLFDKLFQKIGEGTYKTRACKGFFKNLLFFVSLKIK